MISYRPVPAPNCRLGYGTKAVGDAGEISIDWSGILPTGRTLDVAPAIDYVITTLTIGAAATPIVVSLTPSPPTKTLTTSRLRITTGAVGGAYSIACRATLDNASHLSIVLRVDTY